MRKSVVLRNLLVAVVLFGIFYMVPYNHDEWAWGTNEGIENLRNFFQGYNGRYFGDIISILITRSNLFKALVMTSSTIGVFLSIKRFYRTQVSNNQSRKIISLATLLLLLLVPTVLFRQIYGWPAAFVNFVPPVIFVVLYFTAMHETLINEDGKELSLLSGFFIVLGTQFFSENITIFMLILTFSVLIVERIMNKKNSNFFIGSFITALIGSIIMFANPAYLNAAQNTDGYKKIELSIGFIWNKIGSQMLPNMILNYKFLLIVFNLALLILFFKKVNNLSIINKIVTAFVMMYTIYGVFFYGQMNFTFRYDNSIINLFSIAYFICLLWIISSVFSKKELLFNIVLFLSVPLSAAPLIIAEPIGARSFYLTYCLWLLYTGTLYFRLFENIKFENRVYKLLKYLLRIAIGSILVFYFFIFAYMYRVQIQREKIISDSVKSGNTEIVLPLLPNENYTWKTSTGPDNWLNRFKKFYDIPEDKHVTFK